MKKNKFLSIFLFLFTISTAFAGECIEHGDIYTRVEYHWDTSGMACATVYVNINGVDKMVDYYDIAVDEVPCRN